MASIAGKKKSIFDASPSMLGYLYQVRYGLYASLKKLIESPDPDEYTISIEKLDDISFDKSGSPSECLQTKYHQKPGNLTNKSPDLWGSLRVWIQSHVDRKLHLSQSSFFLITNETISENSILSYLSSDSKTRDVDIAVSLLQQIAADTPSAANKQAFELFNSLTQETQEELVSNVFVLDSSPSISALQEKIKQFLRMSANEQHLDAFYSRLEGKWFELAIEFLESTGKLITLLDLKTILDDLREQFLPSNLPADFTDLELSDIGEINKNYTFLDQIDLFEGSSRLKNIATLNYYKAARQRSRWSDDGLLKPGELKRYERKIREEWEHKMSLHEKPGQRLLEKEKMQVAVQVYEYCMDKSKGAIPIRDKFDEVYFARGTCHHLANLLHIGWHPDFDSLLEDAKESGVA